MQYKSYAKDLNYNCNKKGTKRSTLMKTFKKMIALAALVAMVGSTAGLSAQEPIGGYGYNESRTAPSLAPAIALGTIAIVAIVAVAVQNRSHGGHGHGHAHQ